MAYMANLKMKEVPDLGPTYMAKPEPDLESEPARTDISIIPHPERLRRTLRERTLGEGILLAAMVVKSLRFLILGESFSKVSSALLGLHVTSFLLQIIALVLLVGIAVLNYDKVPVSWKRRLILADHIVIGMVVAIVILEGVITSLSPMPSKDEPVTPAFVTTPAALL